MTVDDWCGLPPTRVTDPWPQSLTRSEIGLFVVHTLGGTTEQRSLRPRPDPHVGVDCLQDWVHKLLVEQSSLPKVPFVWGEHLGRGRFSLEEEGLDPPSSL